jgi:ubiquinone/menaquinone biosynthesis C-methylase UbiE
LGLYKKHILPVLVDRACRSDFLEVYRKKVVPLACGKVLEIGIGSGNNLRYYSGDLVGTLVGVDPSEAMWKRRNVPEKGMAFKVVFVTGEAEELTFEANTFDTVVTTYTLCTVNNPDRVLSEVRRVLKPGGQLLLAEHGLAPDPGIRRFQSMVNPVWRRIGGGCNLNRDMEHLLRKARFDVSGLQKTYTDGWRATGFIYWGRVTTATVEESTEL